MYHIGSNDFLNVEILGCILATSGIALASHCEILLLRVLYVNFVGSCLLNIYDIIWKNNNQKDLVEESFMYKLKFILQAP